MLLLSKLFLKLVLLINEFLFSLDVFEHVLGFWQDNVVRENLAVFIVEAAKLWQSYFGFLNVVRSLKEFIDVIKDKVIFENRNNMCIFIVDQIIDNLKIVVITIS